jgi:hypothetical protein
MKQGVKTPEQANAKVPYGHKYTTQTKVKQANYPAKQDVSSTHQWKKPKNHKF